MLSRRVHQRHARGEKRRENHDRPDGQSLRGLRRGNAEQADLRRGVEAEAEEKADEIHLPAMIDQAKRERKIRPKKPRLARIRLRSSSSIRRARLDSLESALDRGQNHEIDDGDGEEKEGRDARADDSADILQRVEPILDRDRRRARSRRTSRPRWSNGQAKKKSRRPPAACPAASACASTLSIAAM